MHPAAISTSDARIPVAIACSAQRVDFASGIVTFRMPNRFRDHAVDPDAPGVIDGPGGAACGRLGDLRVVALDEEFEAVFLVGVAAPHDRNQFEDRILLRKRGDRGYQQTQR